MQIITLILNKIIDWYCLNLTRFLIFTYLIVVINILVSVLTFILFILQIAGTAAVAVPPLESLNTYSTKLNIWLYEYILQDDQKFVNLNEDLNNNLNHDCASVVKKIEMIQESAPAVESNGPKAAGSLEQQEQINDNKESKTESINKDKNYYIIGIGIVISVVVIGILWYYFTSVNVEDISDNSSTISSSSSATIVASEASSPLSTSSTETLLNQTYSQFYFYIANFRNALESMSYQQLYHYIPNFGNGYNLSIDYQLLNFLRERAEAESLDFQRLFSVMGEAPINIFRNNTNLAIFNTLWQPSEAYPTYISFVNHICDEYAEYLMLVDLEID